MAESYFRLLGHPLSAHIERLSPEALARFLYDAPFALLSHTNAPDPVFSYANRKTQELFGYSWEQFTRLPSRLSAEPASRAERQRLLEQVTSCGYVAGYQGIRIAGDGTRFRIANVVIWNVAQATGGCVGQAAMFDRWTRLESQPAQSREP